jgi:hypothetical protein
MMTTKEEISDHIRNVRQILVDIIMELNLRGKYHDASKLKSPEIEIFEIYTDKLKRMDYGSPEYHQCLKDMKPALDHHYAVNEHHPEHYNDGIDGMSLIDLIEAITDWKAASMRHINGNLRKSLEINRDRFRISDQLYHILVNTATQLEWI